MLVVEEDSPKARLDSWGQAVAEVHSDDRRSSHDDDGRLDHQVVDQWVGSGGEGRLGGLVVEHPPPRRLEGHDHHFRPSRAKRPTEEFPARGFSKNPFLLFESSFFCRWIDADDDNGGVLARVLRFPHLPVVVFSYATVSGARTEVVAGSLLLLVTEDFVVLVTWYWILKLIGNWSIWRRMHLFQHDPPSHGTSEDRKSRHRR